MSKSYVSKSVCLVFQGLSKDVFVCVFYCFLLREKGELVEGPDFQSNW